MNATNTGSNFKRGVSILLLVLALVALYYLYKYLFTSSGLVVNEINDKIISAKISDDSPLIKEYPVVPVVYTGGEMTISTWIYVSDWQNVRNGQPKHVLTIGKKLAKPTENATKEQTLAIYLDSYKNDLNVVVGCSSVDASTSASYKITNGDLVSNFTSGTASLNGKQGKVTIKDFELQKWLLVSVCLNNKVADIYMDGKLARSFVLPSMFMVGEARTDSLQVQFAGFGGFGGFIGRSYMSNYAMNPEEIWKTYMSGPGDQPSIGSYISSLFDPDTYKAIKFPKVTFSS